MFATFTEVFEEQYGYPTKSVGLTFLGVGVGALLGLSPLAPSPIAL